MVHPGTGVGVVGPTSLAIQISLGENMKEKLVITIEKCETSYTYSIAKNGEVIQKGAGILKKIECGKAFAKHHIECF